MKEDMIRKKPMYDLQTPPGQVVNHIPDPSLNQPKTLGREIDMWKADAYTQSVYDLGFKHGYAAAKAPPPPDSLNSESSR